MKTMVAAAWIAVEAIALATSFAFAEPGMQSVGDPAGSTIIEGNVGDDNHYILECSGPCNSTLAGTIGPSFTGAWFDPAQSGHGLFVEVLSDDKIQVAWFTFNPAGTEQAWFLGVGTYTGNKATINAMVQPTGGRWIPNFEPSRVVANTWGTLTLTFTDSDHGRAEFSSTLGYGNGGMNLTRLTKLAEQTNEPNWIPTASLNQGRAYHTATLLPNGKVLVVGGFGSDPYPLDSAELYDPATETWVPTGRMNVSKAGHTATLLPDGRVLVVGWANDNTGSATSSAEFYDPSTGTWTVTSAGSESWRDQTATLLRSGKVLFAGGWAAPYASYDRSALFDPGDGSWSITSGRMTTLRGLAFQATVLADGRVLVTGGSNDADFSFGLPNTDVFDPVTNTWSAGAKLHVPRFGHSATLLPDGKVLVAGGDSLLAEDFWRNPVKAPPQPLNNSAELFDPALGMWSNTGGLNVGRSSHTASLLPTGDVLVAGGYTYVPPNRLLIAKQAELYDSRVGSWRNVKDLNMARTAHTATLLSNGKILVAGGGGSEGSLNSAEIYGPASPSTIAPAFTGSWYDPAQNGHGLIVEVLPGQQILAAWFTFNPAGTQQSWFVGVGSYSGNTATISQVLQPTGGRWIPDFDPNRVVNNAWGTLNFTFTDCNHGKVDFASTLGYGSGSMNLTRLTQPAGLTCP